MEKRGSVTRLSDTAVSARIRSTGRDRRRVKSLSRLRSGSQKKDFGEWMLLSQLSLRVLVRLKLGLFNFSHDSVRKCLEALEDEVTAPVQHRTIGSSAPQKAPDQGLGILQG